MSTDSNLILTESVKYCQISSSHRRINSRFSRTVHQRTGRLKQSTCLGERQPTLFLQICGRRIAQICIRWITRSGGSFRTGFICLQDYQCWRTQAAHLWWMEKIDQQLIDSAVKQWHKRLAACVFCTRRTADTYSTCFKAELPNWSTAYTAV